ncbi:MAG: type IV pilus twitching motility protein PilT [Candidatus Aminicenantes bacterium]|nr:type IV pilus twitching motility protein PilT [Candidatus Aminicenantes bacterium]
MALPLPQLLKILVDEGGTDLHITTNSAPIIRVHGKLKRIEHPTLTPADTKQIIYSILNDTQKYKFEENWELDFSFGIKGIARFRGNVFMQRGAVAGAFRRIPYEILSFDKLGLPLIVGTFAERPRGLVLITGPTGSGKTTTLAALIDKINTERADHIITIEDPIEYLHSHKMSMVNQRELHADTKSFPAALRAVLREDPDVVLIGEMRDLETIQAAITTAETGHLTFGTLHTNSASQTINRIIDVFPPHQQDQIRTQLAMNIEGIVTQALLPNVSGRGRCVAVEVLVPSPAVRHLIRDNKIHQIYSSMQTGQEKYGMITFNQSLANLYFKREISLELAISVSHNVEELNDMIKRGPASLSSQFRSGGYGRGASAAAAPAANKYRNF